MSFLRYPLPVRLADIPTVIDLEAPGIPWGESGVTTAQGLYLDRLRLPDGRLMLAGGDTADIHGIASRTDERMRYAKREHVRPSTRAPRRIMAPYINRLRKSGTEGWETLVVLTDSRLWHVPAAVQLPRTGRLAGAQATCQRRGRAEADMFAALRRVASEWGLVICDDSPGWKCIRCQSEAKRAA